LNKKKTKRINRSNTNCIIKFVVILLFALNICAIAQTDNVIEQRISNMLNNKIELDSLKTILGVIIHTKDTSYLRTQLDRIIRVTSKNKNSRNHVYALIVYGQLNTKKTIPY